MLIRHDDGTYTGGPLDLLCILHNRAEPTGRYHPAFLEEAPFPGPVQEVSATKIVRLKSKMHHTDGYETLAEAIVGLDDLANKIRLVPENIWRDPIGWDGEQGIVWVIENWRKDV